MTSVCIHNGWIGLDMLGNNVELYGIFCWDTVNQTILERVFFDLTVSI